ncbi:MAG: hypothetical protein LWW85_13675 [Marinilabiliales bacterium]|nr:hypothetical protein [Marinilabiliales bacterium]
MRRLALVFVLMFGALLTRAENLVPCASWKISSPSKQFMPLFAGKPSVDGKKFDQAAWLESIQADTTGWKDWKVEVVAKDSLVTSVKGKDQLVQMAGFVRNDRWMKATLNIQTNTLFELYLDGKKVKSQGTVAEKTVKVDLTLGTGIHQLLLKMITTGETLRFAASLKAADPSVVTWGTTPGRLLTIHDVLEGEGISGARLSASGKYLLVQTYQVLPGSGKTQSAFRILDLEQSKTLFSLRNGSFRADWLPKTDRLSYQVNNESGTEIWVYDPKEGTESIVATGLKSLERVQWSPNEDYFIFSTGVEAEKPGDLKRIFGNDDRIPNNRNRSYLSIYDLKAHIARPLTVGAESASLHDLSPDGSRMLFSTSKMDYTVVPFSKQTLYELNLQTMVADTLWKDKLYGGSCSYSPDGSQLLVSGGPETFGPMGVKVSKGRIPNSYDGQLFLFDLKSRKAEPLTRDFDPAIERSHWSRDGFVYLTAVERDFVGLYRLDPRKKSFTKLNVPVDVITAADFAENKALCVITGSSVQSPDQLYSVDLNTGKTSFLMEPKAHQLADVKFGASEDWNFVNAAGTKIYGRIYFPVDYDPAKKYPLIVNYYGGTTPTNRAFDGRYPKNVWAAEGYLVYILQPSGSTGKRGNRRHHRGHP